MKDASIQELLEELLVSLSFSGIGGRRSSGMGRFELHFGKLSPSFQKRLEKTENDVMVLSVCLPQDEELQSALEGASYQLKKRSGFVDSETYAPEHRRKQDMYAFGAGSCFKKAFSGQIADVSRDGMHPVYRYAQPFFMGVDV